LSWPLIVGPLLLIALIGFRPIRGVFRNHEFPAQLFRNRIGGIFGVACAAAIVAVILSVIIPSVQLLANRRTWTEFIPAISAGQTRP
jgi:hypothetical protein